MQHPIRFPDSIKLDHEATQGFKQFLQNMADRYMVGGVRYGKPANIRKYLSRLKTELKSYEKTGNIEHLLNVANYAFLESHAPERKKVHHDPTVDSVTRKKFGR